jgi:hypothetical protein
MRAGETKMQTRSKTIPTNCTGCLSRHQHQSSLRETRSGEVEKIGSDYILLTKEMTADPKKKIVQCPLWFAEESGWKVLFTDLLWEKNTIPWLISQTDKFKQIGIDNRPIEIIKYCSLSDSLGARQKIKMWLYNCKENFFFWNHGGVFPDTLKNVFYEKKKLTGC